MSILKTGSAEALIGCQVRVSEQRRNGRLSVTIDESAVSLLPHFRDSVIIIIITDYWTNPWDVNKISYG
jgi:hypothetical protein